LLTLFAGLLAGCAAGPPITRQPLAIEPPATYQADPGAPAAETPPARPSLPTTGGSWWRRFGDPLLDDLVDEALGNSPTLEAAAARLDAALAQAEVAGADRLPRIDAGLNGARRRQNFIGLPIPGAEGDVLSNTSSTRGASLDVAWEADLWGRLRAGSAAALARAEAAEADLAAVRNSLIGQVAKAWFGWLEAREQLRIAEETLDNRARFRQQIEERYRRGLRSALDLRLALASEANSEAAMVVRAEGEANAARRLEVLLARYPGAVSLPEAASGLPARPPSAIPREQPADLLTRRPDLIAAELRMAASGLDVAAARAALYPRLSLNGSIGRSSSAFEDLLDNDFSVWSLAAGLVQPLFQGGRLRAAVSAAEARRTEAAAAYLSTALGAFNEVESALSAERFLDERVAALAIATEQSAAARDLAEQRYRTGLDVYLTVLEAQRQAALSRGQLLLARRLRLEARVDLHLALGGDYTLEEAPNESRKASP
jgi:NodT family efflux transporter outer membrane factor (OMF) lipoprotein